MDIIKYVHPNKYKIEKGLTSPVLEIRKFFARRYDVFSLLNENQINRGLTDKSPLIRYIFAKMCFEDKREISIEQMNLGIKDKNASVRALYLKHVDSISKKDIDFCLRKASIEVIISLLSNSSISSFANEQIKCLTYSTSKRIRRECATSIGIQIEKEKRIELCGILGVHTLETKNIPTDKYKISRYEMERGIMSQHISTRRAFGSMLIDDEIGHASNYQLTRGLKDVNQKVRMSFSSEYYKFYTDKQIEIGVNDNDIATRLLFIRNPNIKLTSKQVGDIFKRNLYKEVFSLSLIDDITFTNEQIELGLMHQHPEVRSIFSRISPFLTDEQIKRGLNDNNDGVVASFIGRNDSLKFLNKEKVRELLMRGSKRINDRLAGKDAVKFTDEQIESLLLNSSEYVRGALAERRDIALSEFQIDRGLNDQNPSVREAFAERTDFKPNEIQVERAVKGGHIFVLLSFLKRNDITLTSEQIEYISHSYLELSIDCALKARKDYMEYEKTILKKEKHFNSNRV